MAIKEEGVSFATLLRDMHKDNSLCEDVQKNMEQERLKEILDDIASGRYSYDNPTIVAEVRGLLGLPVVKQNKLRYIGIIGHQNAGKDYVANYLAQTLERKCEVVKFATKMTEVVAAILGVGDLSLFQDRQWKELKQFVWNKGTSGNVLVSARDVQKMIGTDIMRELVDDNIWVNAFANAYKDPDILYIVSDLRFPNEMQFVQENNGIVVFIENLQAAQAQHKKENGIVHPSEQLTWQIHYGDIQPDYRLLNNDFSDPQPLQDLVTFIKYL